MSTRTRAIGLLVLALTTNSASAVGWSANTTITNYYPQASGNLVFNTASNTNPDGCSTSHWLVVDSTAPNFNQLYAAIMAAHASGETVSLYYNGCLGAYPDITAIAVGGIW